MSMYEVTTEKGRERVEGEFCREEKGNTLVVGNYDPIEIVRSFGSDEWFYYRLVPGIELQVERLAAQRDALAAACEATMEALDGLYGADHNEPLPIDGLTPDRQAAFHRALELVTAALALVAADTAGKEVS